MTIDRNSAVVGLVVNEEIILESGYIILKII